MAALEPVGFFSSKNERITPTNLTQSRSGYAQKDLTDGFVLVRSLRPKHVLVIGSGFGFNVVCLTLGSRTRTRGA